MNPKCPKCSVDLQVGIALQNTLYGPGDVFDGTLSLSGPAEMVPCLKCSECGMSFESVKKEQSKK